MIDAELEKAKEKKPNEIEPVPEGILKINEDEVCMLEKVLDVFCGGFERILPYEKRFNDRFDGNRPIEKAHLAQLLERVSRVARFVRKQHKT